MTRAEETRQRIELIEAAIRETTWHVEPRPVQYIKAASQNTQPSSDPKDSK